MKTTYNVSTNAWQRNTTNILPKHDLYYGTPNNDPAAGIPLGDGDMGSLVWLEADAIHIHINKTDLWDDTTLDSVYNSGEDENLTCWRHGGEITVKFGSPCFEYIYQKEFEQRLSLKDATMRLKNQTPFNSVEAEAYADAVSKTTVLHCKLTGEDAMAPEICLTRWGSRTLWRWYSRQSHRFESGMNGTEAYADGDRMYITQVLNGTIFCLGMAVETEKNIQAERCNKHENRVVMPRDTEQEFTLYYTIALGENEEDAKTKCADILDKAVAQGRKELHQQHAKAWEDFWNTSMVSIKDDYIENTYYLYLYYMNSESRGAYPPHFTSGLWGFYHDFIAWNYYFHYNMQHMYAPLGASGHNELAENYHRLRRNGLDAAYRYAKEDKGKEGAFYHDVADRYGRGADYDSHNSTPASQIAMAMWHHYRYTGDEEFLQNTALPVMRGAAEYYLAVFEKGEDGLYHIYGTTAYEGNEPTDDTWTDIVMVKALFGALKDHVEPECREKLVDVLEHLPENELMDLTDSDWNGEVFTHRLGKGRKPLGDKKVFSMGKDAVTKETVRRMYGDPSIYFYGFPDIELSPLYPAGIFGLKDKNAPAFDTMMNQMFLHNTVAEAGMHWNMFPIYLARMGMAEDFMPVMRDISSAYQGFINGFNAEQTMMGCRVFPGKRWDNVRSVETGNYQKVRPEPFTHLDFETMPIQACALNESLIQSHEGIIRLCPAVRAEDPVSFCLYAEGGFRVNAEVNKYAFVITIDNLRGEGFYLALPEYVQNQELYVYKITDTCEVISANTTVVGLEEVLDFTDSKKGERMLLTTLPMEALEAKVQEAAAPNMEMKECGEAQLGMPSLLV